MCVCARVNVQAQLHITPHKKVSFQIDKQRPNSNLLRHAVVASAMAEQTSTTLVPTLTKLDKELLYNLADEHNLYCELNGPCWDYTELVQDRFRHSTDTQQDRQTQADLLASYLALCGIFSKDTNTRTLVIREKELPHKNPPSFFLKNFMDYVESFCTPQEGNASGEESQCIYKNSLSRVPPLPIEKIEVSGFTYSYAMIHHFRPLVAAFKYNLMIHFTEIEWKDSWLDKETVNFLFDAITCSKTSLHTIKTTNTKFWDEVPIELATYFNCPQLKTLKNLEFSNNMNLASEGVNAVLSALAKDDCPIRLKILNISNCRSFLPLIKDNLFALFTNNRFSDLTHIGIECNPLVDEALICELFAHVNEHTRAAKVSLNVPDYLKCRR